YLGDTVWNRSPRGRYCGLRAGRVVTNELGRPRDCPEYMVVLAGTHEPLIDRDTFQPAQETLGRHRADFSMPPPPNPTRPPPAPRAPGCWSAPPAGRS